MPSPADEQQDLLNRLSTFLGEFLVVLSSTIQREHFDSQVQWENTIRVVERVHQLRSTLLTQRDGDSSPIDMSTISIVLHQLALSMTQLHTATQETPGVNRSSDMNLTVQLLDRLETTLTPCIDEMTMIDHRQVGWRVSSPALLLLLVCPPVQSV